MAPKKGGGSGSSGGSSSSSNISNACPGAFQSSIYSMSVIYFASYCLFFVLALAVLISLCCVRKRHGNAKRLAGPVYMISILSMVTGYALVIIATLLRECRTTDLYSFYDWAIAYMLFFRLSTYLLLVVVVWGVNSLLRERLGTGRQGIFKAINLAILGLMGALTCGYIGLLSWNLWTSTKAGRVADADYKGLEQERLAMAYFVLYLLSVVAGAVMSGVTLLSLRSRQVPIGNLLGWIVTLNSTLVIWNLFVLIEIGAALRNDLLSIEAQQAFAYLEDFFLILSFMAILFLAKSPAWGERPAASSTFSQQPIQQTLQHYAYDGKPGQQIYYQQQPMYSGMPGHSAHVN